MCEMHFFLSPQARCSVISFRVLYCYTCCLACLANGSYSLCTHLQSLVIRICSLSPCHLLSRQAVKLSALPSLLLSAVRFLSSSLFLCLCLLVLLSSFLFVCPPDTASWLRPIIPLMRRLGSMHSHIPTKGSSSVFSTSRCSHLVSR